MRSRLTRQGKPQAAAILRRSLENALFLQSFPRRICALPCSAEYSSDFRWHDTDLYLSPGGTFFIAGVGSAMSMWAESTDNNGCIGGSGLRLATEEEAREYAESARLRPEVYEEVFGAVTLG